MKIMPAAVCNTCSELVPLQGKNIKKASCKCGSSDLSAVAGKWNDQKCGWDYFDRKGEHRIFVEVPIENLLEVSKKIIRNDT